MSVKRPVQDQYDLAAALVEWVHDVHLVETLVNSTKDLCIVPPLLCALSRDDCYMHRPPPTLPLPRGRPKRKRFSSSARRMSTPKRKLGVVHADDASHDHEHATSAQSVRRGKSVDAGRLSSSSSASSEEEDVQTAKDVPATASSHSVVTLPRAEAPAGYRMLTSCPFEPTDDEWQRALIGKTVMCGFDQAFCPGKQHGWFVGRVHGTSIHKRCRTRKGGDKLTHEVNYKTLPKGPAPTPVFRNAKVPHDLSRDTYGPDKWWVCLQAIDSDNDADE